jgi:hypothetical protein
MIKMNSKKNNFSQKPKTLISPQSMGGIHGGEGYTFQDRYIVCHIPIWISDDKFVKLMPEGTGDVDVVFAEGRKHFYDHIQVKDHPVNNSGFVDVVKTFADFETATGKTYRKFILTCPSVSRDIKSLNIRLSRYREFRNNMFDVSTKKALQSTKTELKNVFKRLGILKYFEFVLEKVFLEVNSFDFHNNNVCKRQFAAALTEHPKYKQKFLNILGAAYAHLITEVLAHRGKVLQKNRIQEMINESIAGRKNIFKSTSIHVHNWEIAKYEPKPNINIDWTKHFDRQTRRVPDKVKWDTDLIPELVNIRKNLAAKTVNRNIVFRGKCALSTSIAVGAIFPEIGNWTFELQQPPQTDPWRSDAQKIGDYKLSLNEVSPHSGILKTGSEIALVFSITGRAIPDVTDYFASNSIPIKKIISIEPENTPGNISIQNDSEAVSLASAAKDVIKQMISKYKATKTHLFYFGPAGLAVFLGQKLTSLGAIQLYEFQDPGYKPSCLLNS